MKAKERKAILSSSNNRMVIMGLFNATGCESTPSKGVTFVGAAGDQRPRLTVPDFFEQIAPELRYVKGESVRIGNTAFNSFKLKTPAAAGGVGYGQAITQDSPLLQGSDGGAAGTTAKQWQDAGGRLFKSLLEDLDEVVRFSDGRFSAAVLKLARRYMVDYADSQLPDDKVDRADWERLSFDHAASSSILNYMTCYRADEANARAEVGKALNAHAEGDTAPLNPDRVKQLIEGLERCKRITENGNEDDSYLQAISKDRNYAYLADYAGSKYGISVSGAGAKGFVAHYRYYLQRSNAVHRFVRNGSLHSYLFLWLAGKYTPFESAEEFPAVAKQMYELGVEGQGDKRIPGETREERLRNYEIVRDAQSTLDEEQRATLKESNVYERLEVVLQEGILEKLQPERTFRREALNKRNRELFVALGQMAGGKAGQILNQATDRAEQLSRVYRAVKNVRTKDGEVLQPDAFVAALKRVRSTEMKDFVDGILADLPKLEGTELQKAVCDQVVKAVAVETKTYFDSNWVKDLDAIDEEVRALADIYDLRTKMDVERRAGESRGMPMTVLTQEEISILAPVEASEEERATYAKSIEKAANAAGVGGSYKPAPTPLAVPSQLEELAQESRDGVIKDKEGKLLATITSEPERGLITAKLADDADAAALLGEETAIDFGDLKDLKVVDVEGLDLQPLVAASEEQARKLEGTAEAFGSFSETQALLRSKYVEDRTTKGDNAFTRGARALALGEYMAATPPEESNLGVADLSNVLGIALDMVEHVGAVDDGKMFKAGVTLDPDVLARMNLSVHYPVNNARELSSVLQYHYGQCETLGELTEYFAELSSIRTLFESLQGSNVEVTVYNCKVAEHAGKARGQVRQARDLFVVKEHPVVAYLTSQAEPSSNSIAQLSQRVVATLKRRTDDTASLQVPIVVTPASVDVDGSIFPIVSPSTLPLPRLALAGTDAADADDVIPSTKAGIDSHLALATSLIVAGAGPELGKLDDIVDDQAINVEDALKVNPQDGQFLTELMREGWFAMGSPLCAALCMAKWLNVCLLDEPQTHEHFATLLTSNCLTALKGPSDAKSGDYLVPELFAGLDTKSVSQSKDGFLLYMPQVFEGKNSAPLSGRTQAIALNAGSLGVRDKASGKLHNFGELPFLTTLATLVTSSGGSDDSDE